MLLILPVPFLPIFIDVCMWFFTFVFHFYVAYYSFAIVFVHLRFIFGRILGYFFFHFVYGTMNDCETQHTYSHEKYIIYGDLRRFTAELSGIHKHNINAYIPKKDQTVRPFRITFGRLLFISTDSYLPTHFYLHTTVVYYFPRVRCWI